jgi:hypothetical protein
MHDLQTIIKLNAPVNLRTPALAKAHQIKQQVRAERLAIPALDRVAYYGTDAPFTS